MRCRPLILVLCLGVLFSGTTRAAVSRIKTDRMVVALTLDDGPNPPYTDELLNVLAKKNVKATFFLIGKQVEAHPETALKILAGGHEVGGHSYDWSTLAFKRRGYVESQLDRMEAAFKGIGVTNLVWFRPPNGLLSPGQGRLLKARGLQHISADVVAGDWKTQDAMKLQSKVLKKVKPGSIVVLHDGGGDRRGTIAAVSAIIDALREQGFSFLTVGELLELRRNDAP